MSEARESAGGRWGVLAAAAGARAVVGFQFQALPALGPALAAGLGLSLSQIGALTGLYMAPGVAVALLAGAMLQRVGVRETLILALAAMTAGGALAVFAEGFQGLAAARLLGGFGGVVVTVAGLKALYDVFPERDLALANALAAASQPFGMGCALLIFATLGTGADWALGLGATGALSALALLATLRLVPRTAAQAARGASLRFPRAELASLALACATVVFFVGCFYGFLSLFPAYLHARGWDGREAGLLLGAFGWAPVIMAPLGGVIAARLRRPGPVFALCILAWGASTVVTGLGEPAVLPILLMLVCGPAPLGWVMSLAGRAVAAERRGLASGVFMAAFFLGASAMPAIAAAIGEAAGGRGTGEGAAIAVCGAAFMLALIPLLAFEARVGRPQAATG
ncbi:MAG: MFS transporter [Pseudomonadota bacterium]